jgi:hypothetical protein
LSLAITLEIIPFTETNSDLPKVSSEAAAVLPKVVGLVISGSRAKQVCSSLVVYIFFLISTEFTVQPRPVVLSAGSSYTTSKVRQSLQNKSKQRNHQVKPSEM